MNARHSIKIIDAGPLGKWEFSREQNEIVFWNEAGEWLILDDHELLHAGWDWTIQTCPSIGSSFVLEHHGDRLYYLDGQKQSIRECARLNRGRDDDHGFYRQHFEVHSENVLLIYEPGLICLNERTTVKWRRDDHYLDCFYGGVENGLVKYSHEKMGLWFYDLNGGDFVSLP